VLFRPPFHHLAVVLAEAMAFTECACILPAQLGMVAAASLGDVVEQSGNIQHLRTCEFAHQPAAQRYLVRVLGQCEAAQLRTTIRICSSHGVDMEQVVLHLSDDAAERGCSGRGLPYWFMRRSAWTMP